MAYYSWSLSGLSPNAPQFSTCSPNLVQLNHYISKTWGGHTLGCKVVRPIAGSDRWSTHAYGAAIDIRLPSEATRLYAVAFMMDNFDKLGLNAIHDYRQQKIYKDDHQWHAASIGSLGADWWHVEVTPGAYADGRSVEDKIAGVPVPVPPAPPAPPGPGPLPPYDPLHHKYGLWPVHPKQPMGYGFGYSPGTNSDDLQNMVKYFKHVCIIEEGIVMKEPYTVFLDDGQNAVRVINAKYNANGNNVAQAREAWLGVCGDETWKIIDRRASGSPA